VRDILSRVSGRALAIAVAVVLLVATFITFHSEGDTHTVSAHFSRAVQLFKGSEVRILGVKVGSVTSVVPEGNSVRVDMQYDGKYKVPANAQAVIITPTLTADRFVQLTPAYTSGPQMQSGGDIPLQRTGSPVELDRIYKSLDVLSTALGPNGANKNGSLDTLMHAGRNALEGEGAKGNQMIMNLSQAVKTFGDGSGELFSTVRGLQEFTTALARNDQFVSSFIADLAGVSQQLSGERQELRGALANLATAVGQVQKFVKDNKAMVTSDVKSLTSVTTTLAQEKDNIALALEKGPLGLNNLALAYDNETGSIGARFQVSPNASDVDGFLCALVRRSSIANANLACKVFKQLLTPLEKRSGGNSPTLPSLGRITGKGTNLHLGASRPATSLGQLLGGQQ
jgi:phospholipid/cholesterol/gamma-HCH transport system substrate-binding protein